MPLALALLAWLALAAPAAAQWRPPQLVGTGSANLPGVTFGADATALAWWLSDRGWRLARRPQGRPWTGCRPPGRGELVEPVVSGGSRMVLGLRRGRRLFASFGSTRACTTGRFRRVAVADRRIVHPRLAASARGDVALAWWEDRGTHNDRVRVALRRPGRRFGRPRTLAEGRVRHATVAVGALGDVLVAWEARGQVRARITRPGRRRFGPVETIRSRPTYGARVEAAVGADGRAYLAWTAQFRSEGGDVGPARVQATVRMRDQPRFRRAQLLEEFEGRTIEEGRLRLALDARGNATVAWTGLRGIETARSDPEGRFGSEQQLAEGELTLADLAVSDAGAAVALWDAGSETQSPLLASYRPPGEIFGPPERVAASGRYATAAFPPASDTPTALWWQPDGLRSADRSG